MWVASCYLLARSQERVFGALFSDKALGSARFHDDFNRPLNALWDQRESSSFLSCHRKWFNGRLKSAPNRARSCSMAIFCDMNTLSCGWHRVICSPAHKRGCVEHYFLTKHLAVYDSMTISIVRYTPFGITAHHHLF